MSSTAVVEKIDAENGLEEGRATGNRGVYLQNPALHKNTVIVGYCTRLLKQRGEKTDLPTLPCIFY